MKKVLLSTIIIGSFFVAKAQTGTVLVGGNINFYSFSPKDPNSYRSRSFDFNPYVGYQFNNNWTAGITSTLNFEKQKDVNADSRATSHRYGAGPFVRYTQSLSPTFSMYGQLEGLYINSGGQQTINNITAETSNERTLAVNLFPAVFINLKNNFGLNFNIGGVSYTTTKLKSSTRTLVNDFNINFGKTATIGISKNFGGKK